MQPVIGITTYQTKNEHGFPYVMVSQAYIQAVMQAGRRAGFDPFDFSRERLGCSV